MKKILVFIGSRANYASIKSLLNILNKNKNISLEIVLAASALSSKFGNLENLIRKDGFKIKFKIYSLFEGENHYAMTRTIGQTINDSVSVIEKSKPDWALVIGDRNEVLGFAISCAYMNIRLAHTMGGEISGTIDESARHAITKFSHLHFTACNSATQRILMMGEHKKNIIQSGCPRIDEVKKILSFKKISNEIYKEIKNGVGNRNIDINKKFILLSFHPVTTEKTNYINIKSILDFLIDQKLPVIALWPNSDANADLISKCYRKYREKNKLTQFSLHKNFSFKAYITLMSKCYFLIGNSSSGVREGAFIGCRTINIGTRQNKRDMGSNVINVNEPITKLKIKKALNTLSKRKIKKESIYGKGNASQIILNKLLIHKVKIQKNWNENIYK